MHLIWNMFIDTIKAIVKTVLCSRNSAVGKMDDY